MDTITYPKLVDWLASQSGLVIIGLHCLTEAKQRKTGNPHFPIFKRVQTVGLVGADYELAVNREAMRQSGTTTFKTGKLPWGEWLLPHKVITHNGALYLRTMTTPGKRRKQPAKVIAYYSRNGNKLEHNQVKEWLSSSSESSKQQAQTGIDSTVWVRTYAFESIQRVRIAGKTYKLKP